MVYRENNRTITYEGCLMGDLKHGDGTLEIEGGVRLKGHWAYDLLHGQALTYKGGTQESVITFEKGEQKEISFSLQT